MVFVGLSLYIYILLNFIFLYHMVMFCCMSVLLRHFCKFDVYENIIDIFESWINIMNILNINSELNIWNIGENIFKIFLRLNFNESL